MQRVEDGWERFDDEIRIHYAVLQQAMEEAGIHWPKSSASPQQGLKLVAPLEKSETPSAVQLPPAPIGTKPKRAEPIAAEAPSAEEQAPESDHGDEMQPSQAEDQDEVNGIAEDPEQLSASREEEPEDEPLNSSEQCRLAELEGIIKKGLATFFEMGAALIEIRDCRLYRRTHRSFEAYCRQKWQMAASRARKLMLEDEVVRNLKDTPDESVTIVTTVTNPTSDKSVTDVGAVILPTSERQTRPLSGLGREQQRQVWQKSLEVSHGAPSEPQVRRRVFLPNPSKR